jgi:type 1 glutamine amidotransferase
MVTATAGFRHDSIPAARQALQTIAAQSGEISVVTTEDLSELSAARLASLDVLMFALTSGELALDATQKSAIVEFIDGGGGFIGVHSAADTLYEWPDYGRLIGAYFKEHPWTQEAVVSVEDRAHPASADLAPSIRLLEEFYIFRTDPRLSGHVLLALDPSSVGAAGDFPLAWSQSIGRGRSYYNALGHFPQTWADVRFQTMLRNAIRWVGARI